MDKSTTRFGAILRKARQAKRLTQSEVAEKLGFTRQLFSSWELGRNRPKKSNLKDISEYLSVDFDVLDSAYNSISEDKEKGYVASDSVAISRYEAEERLLDGYCGLIKIKYHEASDEQKTKMRSILESLVN